MSQSAALLAARSISGSAASCSGRGVPSHFAPPRAHLTSLPLASHSRTNTAAGRIHALCTGASNEGTAVRLVSPHHSSSWGQQRGILRKLGSRVAPLRATSNYEDEEEEEDEDLDPLDEDDIVPGAILLRVAGLPGSA